MRTRVDMADAVGKTIEKVSEPNGMVILFTDGTYARLVAEPDGCDEAYLSEYALPVSGRHGVDEARVAGVLTPEEAADRLRRMAEVEAETLAAKERADYERLKVKFESHP